MKGGESVTESEERRAFSVTVDMGTYFHRFLVVLLLTFVGLGIWSSGEVYALGSINVPQVNDHFDKFDKSPAPKQEQPIKQNVKEEKGTWDWLTKPVSGAWNWTVDKVSSVWKKTKKVCSEAWDWICEVCDRMTQVVVDGLSSAWNWIVKYKEYVAFAAVVLVGIALCFVPPLGEEILAGVALSFIMSVMMNGGKIDKTTFMEAAIGGLLGLLGGGIAGGVSRGLASGLGQKLLTGVAKSRVLGPLVRGGGRLISKLPGPIQKVLGKSGFISSVEGAGTSMADDLLHGRKIDWKKALISGVAGAALVGIGAFIVPKIEPMVNKVTTAFREYTEPIFAKANRLEKCFSYQQPTQGYFAAIQFPNCFYSPDAGGGSGKGKARTSSKVLTSFDEVASYIKQHGKLPDNFITKSEAKKLGWDPKKGNLAQVAPGKSIGGDIFKNKEGLLPDAPGRIWYEADINYTSGYRGNERILFSNDGLIYKTTDHYKTFTRIK